MSTLLLVLLSAGFLVGFLCVGVGLYLIGLRTRGVAKLGEVPGVGEIGTLPIGVSLTSMGAYCFYYSFITFVPLQNGAILQQRVDKLLVETSRDLRKEYNDVLNRRRTLSPDVISRIEFLINFQQRIDPNNGHASYFAGELKRLLDRKDESHTFFYRYFEEQDAKGSNYRDGGTGSETCYERARGFCAQRSAWIHHLLTNDFFTKAMSASEPAEKSIFLDTAARQTSASLADFPQGFVQTVPTKVLQARILEESKK